MKNLLIRSVLVGFTMAPIALAVAQEVAPQQLSEADANLENNQAAAKKVERIEVTGSRLKGVDMEGAQPLVTISSADIKNSAANSVSGLLREIGQTRGGTGSFSTASSGSTSGSSPAGQAAASLRGLGTSSTLTLINGRRVAVSSFAYGSENFVDINAIPLAAIERIEILPTGASAIYGADAVAGVINYILKKDFDGAELNMSYGDSEASTDDAKKNLNLVWGKTFGNTHVTAFVDYYDRNPTFLRDREQTQESFFPSKQHGWASYNTLFFDLAKDKVDPNCPDEYRFDDRDDAHPAERFYEYCAYNSNQYRPYQSEFEQLSTGVFLNTEFENGIEWFTEITYSETEGTAESSSAPLNGIEVPFFDPRDPDQLHPSLLNADGSLNPVGQAFDDFYQDAFGGIIDDAYQIYGRLPDNRIIKNETESFRVVSGFSGSVGDWFWESAVILSKSESDQVGVAGIASRDRLEAALNGALCADGSICEPGQGLMVSPYNNWEQVDGINSQAAWDLIYQNVPRRGESSLYSWDLSLSGDIYELEAGPIAAAFGAEIRYEEIEDIPSEMAEGTFENGFEPEVIRFGATRAEADRTSWSVYGEFNIPLTAKLDMQVAGRYDDYDDFGSDFNPKVGFRYQPIDGLIMRGSWATSFRAPSLSQTGAGVSLASENVECKDSLSAYADCDGVSDFSIDTIEFGNSGLGAEEADSYNAGLAYSPNEDITMTVDYWYFDHEELVAVDAEYTLLAALEDSGMLYCGDVPADQAQGVPVRCDENGQPLAPYVIDGDVHLQLQNLGTQETKGIDFTYTQYLTAMEVDWTFLVDVTHVFSFKRKKSESIGEEELAETYQYPDTLVTTGLKWSKNDFFGSVTMLYTSDYEDNELDSLTDFDLDRLGVNPDRRVPSWTKFNAVAGYDFGENITVRLSVENLFDREAPTVYGSSQNVDVFNHDILGRFYRLSYTHSF